MDPNLFRMNWDVLIEVLATVTILSIFIERALSIIFEHRFYVSRLSNTGLKEVIAFGLSLLVVANWQFDVLSIILQKDVTSTLGYVITAAIIAGGSKGSIKLFSDVLKMKSTAAKKAADIKVNNEKH